ncbi:MAG TPA: MFS transporter [Nocardioidaceae bacterium]|nr:MFS transporter [Nocardioidaceae bacterium]
MRLPDSLTPLRDRRFAWYYVGRVVSTTGSMMAPVALTFAVLDLTDSASALGLVLAARTIPLVVFLLVGGVVADRFSRSTVMQVSHILSALTQGMVAYLVIGGHAELWMIVALEAANGTVAAFSFPAMASVVPQLAPRSHLQQANALLSFSRAGLAVIGPTIAALLVVSVGSGWALAVDAATWLLAAACMSKVRLPARRRTSDEPAPNMLRELREGWTVFTGHTWLWMVVVAFGVLNAIHAGAWFTLGPALAKDTIGEAGWGYVLSAESLGLLLMTLVMLRVSLRHPLRTGLLGCALLSVPLLMLGIDPEVLPLVMASFCAGAGIEVFSIGWSVAMQENIEERVLSRAYSYDALGSFLAMPVGQLVYGPLGEIFGYRDVLVVSAVIYAAVALLPLMSRSVRDLGRVSAPTAEPVSSPR